MSYTTELTDDYAGIVHVGKDIVTGPEVIEACRLTTQLVQNTENFHYQFIDFSEVEELRISREEFDQIVVQDYYAAVYRPNAAVVIVAPQNQVFEIAKAWQHRIEDIGWTTHVSRSRADAKNWLRENFSHPAPATERHPEDAPSN
jgi:hypothetical protein